MNNTKNPTALQSQRWILQALLDTMEEKNYDKITVSEICRTAELDRRTFYRNFNSKQEVLEQYIEQLRREYMAAFCKLDKPDKESATLLFFQFWKEHLQFIRNLQRCGLESYVFDQFERFTKSKRELLIDGPAENVSRQYLLAFRIGGFWNVMLTWAENGANISPEELTSILLQQ